MTTPIQRIRVHAASQRAQLFRRFIEGLPRPLRLLDLGGAFDMWQRWGIVEADGIEIVLLNNHAYDTSHGGKAAFARFACERIGDVRSLRAADLRSFDLVFSNSMFEHLYTRDAQHAVAREVQDSGRPFFIQVPNRRCPVDPHFPHPLAPFFALWPRPVQAAALSVHGLGSGGRSSNVAEARHRLSNYVPIARGDLQGLFPRANVVTEWSLGLPMSLVALSRSAA